MLLAFAAFNPHATFTLQDRHGALNLPATGTTWQKWLPRNPTCPWWYTAKRLEGLITAHVAAESSGGPKLSVRDFIVDFAGLAGSGKSKAVLEKCGLSGKRLNELVRDGDVDIEAVAQLLKSMQGKTRPVKPKALGVLGAEHLTASLVHHHQVDERSVRYKRVTALTDTELPFVLEVAFGVRREDNEQERKVLVGLNWSPALRVPIEQLHDLLGTMRVDDFDPAVVLVHLACPRLDYIDKGKRMLVLPTEIEDALEKSVRSVAKTWKQEKRHADREDRLTNQQLERVRKAKQPHHLTIKDAAYQVMEQAYLQASADDKHPDRRLPANARQVMYAARPGVLKLTGGQCWSKSSYFTQHLLPDFMEEHPELTADWDVVFDARGHLSEPHTGRRIDLGTLQVRKYLKACTNGVLEQSPEVLIDHACPTVGPHNRFHFALFVEKEGFDQLLVSAGIAARFDVAIMSTKGMSVTAARQLVERFSERGVTILVLHDFDKSGFSILHTLRSDTRRYQFKVKPRVVDIGLRLEDVREMGLQSEVVHYPMSRSDPRIRLRACGATQEECEFLMHRQTLASPWEGERVELNAMTAAQFIAFLVRKLIAAGAIKLVPDKATLEAAFRQAYRIALAQQAVDSALAATRTSDVPVPPANLRRHISKLIRGETLAWDEAIWQTVRKQVK